MIDDGVGVPDSLKDRVFEPRVTSKLETMVMDRWGVHGRGMALFSIRTNAVEAHIASSGSHKGAALVVVSDVQTLPERADQSTWPTVERDDEGVLRVSRGPHNIVRRAVEFAVEHPGVDVFIGSPTEILATLVMLARFELDQSELLFCEDLGRLPVWQRPGATADAGELADTAAEIGLPVSERTAHRILGGEIAPLHSVLSVVTGGADASAPVSAPDIYRDRRGLKIHHSDLDSFQDRTREGF